MYFSALCLFNCLLLSDMPGCGLQVSCGEQGGILIASHWRRVKEKAPQALAIAVAAGSLGARDGCSLPTGGQLAPESLIPWEQRDGGNLF